MKNNKSNNKIISLFTVFLMIASIIIMPTKSVFAETGDVITEGNFKYTVLDENSVSLTGVVDKKYTGDMVVPSEVDGKKVVEIGKFAFYNCQWTTSIEIPNTVTKIGKNAFFACKAATKINIPDGVEIVDEHTFDQCFALESITLPKNLKEIKTYAFSGCAALKYIEIPEGITAIPQCAFFGCTALKEITIPKNVESIITETNIESFKGCTSLKTIKGYKGSYARTFARKYGYDFVALDVAESDKEYTISFDPDNGTDEIVTQKVYDGEVMTYTPNNSYKKEGYMFVGWYKDVDYLSTEYTDNSTYTSDVTYTAKWAHLNMMGAQVRLDGTGIRFGTKVYTDDDEIVEKGTLIIPVTMVSISNPLTLNTKNSAKSIGKVNYEVNEKENYIIYLGTLVNVPESQYSTYMTATAYVTYKDKAGAEYTVLCPYSNSTTGRIGMTTISDLLNS